MHADPRIRVWHLALYLALVGHWEMLGFKNPFYITRRKLMALSHIGSVPTYHKYLKELIAFGYIGYQSSFHPVLGSLFRINRAGAENEKNDSLLPGDSAAEGSPFPRETDSLVVPDTSPPEPEDQLADG